MKCTRAVTILGFIGLISVIPTAARGATVTFDTFAPQQACLDNLSDGGLDFAESGSICMGVWPDNPNSNGTPGLILGYTGMVSITQTGGGAFDLNAFDMAISWYETAPVSSVDVTAYFEGGGSSMQTLLLIPSLQTYLLNLANVVQVDVSALSTGGGYWVMDNIDFNGAAVPEPATLTLVAGGMIAAAVRRRRRRS